MIYILIGLLFIFVISFDIKITTKEFIYEYSIDILIGRIKKLINMIIRMR